MLFKGQGPVKSDAEVHWVGRVYQFFPFPYDFQFSRCSSVVQVADADLGLARAGVQEP